MLTSHTAANTQEGERQSGPEKLSRNQGGRQSAFQFADQGPDALQRSRLQALADNSTRAQQSGAVVEMANHGPRTQQLKSFQAMASPKAQAATIGKPGEMVQRISIKGTVQTPDDLKRLIAAAAAEAGVELDKKQSGKLIGEFKSATTDYTDELKAIEAIAGRVRVYASHVEASQKAETEGDNTEEAAASIIGGKINRSHGRDVEWRLVDRGTAEELKKFVELSPGSSTDQALFEAWKDVLRVTGGVHKGKNLNAIISTPVDAFSDGILALAGGLSKFEEGGGRLNVLASNRVSQLKALAGLLEYRPLLVFSAAVSCRSCQAVADHHGVDVEHLGLGEGGHLE